MTESKKPQTSGVLPLSMVIVVLLAMVGASAIAMLLIPQLSLPAAVRGTTITMSVFLGMQIALRFNAWRKQRGDRA